MFIKSFSEINRDDADIAGGKGASLGEITQAGIPVPDGFVVLSSAFEQFIEETDINVEIDSILHDVDPKAIHTVDKASEQIQALIKGVARGKVKLVKFDTLSEIQKISQNVDQKNILVTGMTNPNMTVLIGKVGGIITDEGGMACHAAIISREFNLPCLVGCKIATQVLKDGDLVEVDADHGIVRILKE